MILTAVFALSFLMNLRFKQVNDVLTFEQLFSDQEAQLIKY